MLKNSVTLVAKVSSFDKPVFLLVFERGFFNVEGGVGAELTGKRGFVCFGVGFEGVEEGFGVEGLFRGGDESVIGLLK